MDRVALIGVLLLGGLLMARSTPRGIRNNNPGNIEYNPANDWRGQTGTDGLYATFSEPVWGIRALAKLLRNYQSRYGLNTITEIILRWAPPQENDSVSYIKSVSSYTGFKSMAQLNLADKSTLLSLVKAIIHHENGQQPYPDETILGAFDLL